MKYHTHDCDTCVHLGSEEYRGVPIDFYFCPSDEAFGQTLIARDGDEGSYSSGMCFYGFSPTLTRAGNLALNAELLTIEEINKHTRTQFTGQVNDEELRR